jgi:hypothetical protein
MPNWCNNILRIGHENHEMLDRFEKAFLRGETCHGFIPMPDELRNSTSPNDKENSEANIKKYGYADWYAFAVDQWGTKWDFGSEHDLIDGGFLNGCPALEFAFDTAWSPPIPLYEKLVELGYTVQAYYLESGMCFCGSYSDGEQNYHEYDSSDEKTLKSTVPASIYEVFGMENWEFDEEE